MEIAAMATAPVCLGLAGMAVYAAAPAIAHGGAAEFGTVIQEASALLTVCLTAILAGVGLGQYKVSQRQAETAEQQTALIELQADLVMKQKEIARQGHLATHRPRLWVRNVVVHRSKLFGRATDDYFRAGEPITGQFYLANRGGSNGLVVDALVMVHWTDRPHLPMERPYEGQNGNIGRASAPLAPGASIPIPFTSALPVPEKVGASILHDTAGWKLYVLGWVEYQDGTFDIQQGALLTRRTAFCRLFDPQTQRFRRIDDEDYEHAE